MSRSKVVLALTLVVALSFTVPALAGKSSPIKVAKKALGLAKKADKRSRTALKRANTANAKATAALTKANAPVTEAAHAGNADHATNADHAAAAGALDSLTVLPLIRADGAVSGADYDTARAAAAEIPLFAKGPLRVYAKCFGLSTVNHDVYAEVYVATTQNGVIFAGQGNSDSNNGYLNSSTPETERVLNSRDSADPVGTVNPTDAGDGEFYAFAPDGTVLQGHVYLATKAGSPAVGDGAFGAGKRCLISGRAIAS